MRLTENSQLLVLTDSGLYCPEGDFYIDPWRKVERAVITHAHSDHARYGMGSYLCASPGAGVLAARVGDDAAIDTLDYGEFLTVNGVRLSLHPAGHVLGSAQVRLELDGEIAVVSGDYKVQPDTTCNAFEPLRCHSFVTESTFGLPIFRWPDPIQVFDAVNAWWQQNQEDGFATVLMGYSLGKSQRILSNLDPSIGPILVHGALTRMNREYRAQGVDLPETMLLGEVGPRFDWSQALIVAPPNILSSPLVKKFGDFRTAYLSGWMALRGHRRQRGVDRAFVVSDHVDWPALLDSIAETRAEKVWVTHGYTDAVVRYLREQGTDARPLRTEFEGEADNEPLEKGHE